MSISRIKENYTLFLTVEDFKLTRTTANVKRGTAVPLLSERAVQQGKCFRGDQRLSLRWPAPYRHGGEQLTITTQHTHTHTILHITPAAHVHAFFKLLICLSISVFGIFIESNSDIL